MTNQENQERAKALLPFVQAMAEGKVVEARSFGDKALWWDADFENIRQRAECAIEMLRIRPEKRKVPLGPEDVPPGSVVRTCKQRVGWFSISVYPDSVVVFLGDGPEVVDYQLLQQHHWEISRDGGKTWGPCWKEVEE